MNILDDIKTSHCVMPSEIKKEHSAVVISCKQQLLQALTNAEEMNEFTVELINEV